MQFHIFIRGSMNCIKNLIFKSIWYLIFIINQVSYTIDLTHPYVAYNTKSQQLTLPIVADYKL